MAGTFHIYGLNAHGIAAARLALAAGVPVTASDLKAEAPFVERVRKELPGLQISFGSHPQNLLDAAHRVVVSPGVVQDAGMWHRVADDQRWISSADFAWLVRRWPNPVVVVTGTYGKTTFCALLAACLARNGRGSLIAGNYGSPVPGAEPATADDVLILELDYQQLVASRLLRAGAAVILNADPEAHVFGSDELYVRTKLRAADLVPAGGRVLVGREVAAAAADLGLSCESWTPVAPLDDLSGATVPAATAGLLDALLPGLGLPRISAGQWRDLEEALPPGRLNRIWLAGGVEMINGGAAKGRGAVENLAEILRERPPAVLITHLRDLQVPEVEVVVPADEGVRALDTAVRNAKDLLGKGPGIVAYSPGTARLGPGFASIPDRIERFEAAMMDGFEPAGS